MHRPCHVPTSPSIATEHAGRILLVDRSDDLRYFIRICLESVGCSSETVDHARTGVEAVRLLNRSHRLAIVGAVAAGHEPLTASIRSGRKQHGLHVLKLYAWGTPPTWCDVALQHPFTASDMEEALDVLLAPE
jgi:CheY-like chemotaxis protein